LYLLYFSGGAVHQGFRPVQSFQSQKPGFLIPELAGGLTSLDEGSGYLGRLKNIRPAIPLFDGGKPHGHTPNFYFNSKTLCILKTVLADKAGLAPEAGQTHIIL